MRWVANVVFICLYLLITFFGLGPVLLADGVLSERILTAAVVLFMYVVITYLYVMLLRKLKI
ncbi:DUF6954 family protein [Cytobacillus sp. FJAT-54145]|uniref:DUF6954 family protein n=1 Tax=Cytobacillus spartinae TaxID=3299023 RepID=A0ABW6K9Y9_9BACI